MIPLDTLSLLQASPATHALPLGPTATLAAATVATGLAAGVFYTFQTSIIVALAEVDDDAYVSTFQWINRKIVNPGFAVTFFGAPVLIAAALVTWWGEDGATAATIGAGLALQLTSLAITAFGNIPLNTELDRAGTVTGEAATAVRTRFESRWNRLHAVRTAASIASFIALGVATVVATR